jgi:hypothetical protein
MRGLLASSITMFVFFLVWSILLLIFKIFAPSDSTNKTRWLAGKPLKVEEPPSKSTKPFQYTEWKSHYDNVKRQVYCFRAIVLFAGLSIIISAIVMSIGGTNSLRQTLDSARLSIGIVHGLATDAVGIIDQVIGLNQNVSTEIFTLLEDVNGMCPLVRDPLCDNLQNLNTCDVSGFLGSDLNDIFKQVIGHFAAGDRSVIYQEIIKAKSGLQDVQGMALDAEDAASQFNWALIVAMVFSLLLATLCVFIMSSLVFRLPKMISCLKSRAVMPIFVLLVIISYVFSLLFVTASMATADLCVYETPRSNVDMRVLTLLGRFQETLSPIVVEFARFYIRQCPQQLLPKELVEQMDYVMAGVPAIQQFSAIVEESTDLIQSTCGFEGGETQKLLNLADTVQVKLCEVADILKQVRLFFQCENWFPLYETTTYQAICYDGTDGFAYIASTQFIIVFMAFIILTFRVAFWDVQIGDRTGDDNKIEDEIKIKKTDTDETSTKEDEKYYKGISGLLKSSKTANNVLAATADDDKSDDDKSQKKKKRTLGSTKAVDATMTTFNSRSTGGGIPNDLELEESRDYFSEGSTQDNTDIDDASDQHSNRRWWHRRGVDPPAAANGTNASDDDELLEEEGIEVEYFNKREDAWAIWARQFAVGLIGTMENRVFYDHDDNDGDNEKISG